LNERVASTSKVGTRAPLRWVRSHGLRSPQESMDTLLIGRVRTLSFAALVVCLVASLASAHSHAGAQDRTDYLVRLLSTSSAFRVRAQAALSLGSSLPAPAITTALIAALHDDEAAVRAAAAQSLGRVGDSTAIAPLQALARDPETAVQTAATAAIAAIRAHSTTPPPSGTGTGTAPPPPSGPARFYVGVGAPGSSVSGISPATLTAARAFVVGRIATTPPGIVVAPAGETVAQATAEIRRRGLTGYFLDISITALETRPDGSIYAAVSIVVQQYPSHNIVSMASGGATAQGAGERAVLEAALGSALGRVGAALR
jgi:hypothetical protein